MWKEKKNLIINLFKLIVTILVFYFIFKKVPTNEIIKSFIYINIKPLFLAIILGFLFTLFKIIKWHLLLKDLSIESSLLKSAESYFIGMSIGLITPGRVGEIARIGNIDKERRVEGLSLVILDKVFDLLAVLILALAGFYIFLGRFIFFLLGIIILFSLFTIFDKRIIKKLKNIFPFNNFPDFIQGLINLKRKTLLKNFLLSLLSYSIVLVEVYFLANSFERFSFTSTFIGYPIVMLVNLIPITIGGLGVREGTAVFILGKLGLSQTASFNSAFLLFLINTALPAIIGLVELNKNAKKSSLLFIITIIGFLLRIFKITERSLWLDEAITAQVSQSGILGIILNRSQTGIHPPLYFILVYFWTRIFGDSELALRSLSMIFGVLSIPLLYKLVKKIFDETTALISSLIFALSPFLIYFSQEARMYPLFTFLALLSLNYTYDLSNKEFSKKNLIKLLIINSLLLYIHFFSSLLIIAENIFFLICHRKNLKNIKNWIIIQFITLFIFSPWLYVILTRNTPEVYQGAQKLSLFTIKVSFYQFFFGFARSFIERLNLHYYLSIIFLGLIFLGLLPPYENKKGILLNILYFFLPFITLIIISSFGKSFYSSRYLSPFVPALFILMARGIKKFKYLPITTLIIIFIIGIYSVLNVSYFLHIAQLNRPWRDVVGYIHENSQEDHIVLISEHYYYRPFEYYNRGRLSYIPVNPDFFYPEKMEKDIKNYKKIILILSDINPRTLKIKEWLDNKFKYREKVGFYKVTIYIYES
ncbi:flippase-like domain-containing protein [Dictyoglomus thermophilum]|uniref:flippase-like domain-containing protein n=1 Tax=Dictyoglomus thermophilum TaxID=14 RepID=UPI0011EAF42B|nr:flippase-like domain-containing protein [Dictyoglomus thermophilum]TYT24038.1 flippase-like domain-containing protein [Dictyoglomus thermophilum]